MEMKEDDLMFETIFELCKYPTFYKYSSWTPVSWDPFYKEEVKCKGRENFENNSLYFSSPEKFNDPFDCNLEFGCAEISESDLQHRLFKLADENNLKFNSEIEKELQIIGMAKNIIGNGGDGSQINKWLVPSFRNSLGVACLSEVSDSILMWSHYAQNHTGYCIGFDGYELAMGLAKQQEINLIVKVRYEKKYPFIPLSEDLTTYENVIKRIMTKFKTWKYEREWRLASSKSINLPVKFNANWVTKIIMGMNMPQSERELLRSRAKIKYPNANLFEAKMKKKEFGIDIVPLTI